MHVLLDGRGAVANVSWVMEEISGAATERHAKGRDRGTPPLLDGFGRRHTYLRVSVTDRCDLACIYCTPPEGEVDHTRRPDLLTFEELARVVTVFAGVGVERVRFTGGEPLVRKDFLQMVELVRRRTGLRDLRMTTNASRLAPFAAPLARAGIRGVNISLDSLDPERFRYVTRGGSLEVTLEGIHAAVDAGMKVKLNAVVLGGVNDDELGRLVDFAWEIGATPRFIELMPIGYAAGLRRETFMPIARVVGLLGDRVEPDAWRSPPGRGPARYLPAADGSDRRVGFITAMSEHFCGDCNRLRVTASGEIRPCLASPSGAPLRALLRSGASDSELADAIRSAIADKGKGHRMGEGHAPVPIGMSSIGG